MHKKSAKFKKHPLPHHNYILYLHNIKNFEKKCFNLFSIHSFMTKIHAFINIFCKILPFMYRLARMTYYIKQYIFFLSHNIILIKPTNAFTYKLSTCLLLLVNSNQQLIIHIYIYVYKKKKQFYSCLCVHMVYTAST